MKSRRLADHDFSSYACDAANGRETHIGVFQGRVQILIVENDGGGKGDPDWDWIASAQPLIKARCTVVLAWSMKAY